jgi:hypothetical protein
MDEFQNLTLPFDQNKQNALAGHLFLNVNFFKACSTRIKPEWFLSTRNANLYALLLQFHNKHGFHPSIEEFKSFTPFVLMEPRDRGTLHAQLVLCIGATQNIRLDVIKPELTEWLHSVILMRGLNTAKDDFNNKKIKECYEKLMAAIKEIQSASFEKGNEVTFANYKEYLQEALEERREALTTGLSILDRALMEGATNGSLLKGETTIVMGPVNQGKCHGIDTPIMMADGTIKMVQNVVSGDLLMAPDGTPRKVLSTTKGWGPLYRIIPKSGGDSFVCNDAHILSLKLTKNGYGHGKGDIINIPVTDYISKSDEFKYYTRLWRASLDFSEKELEIDPYILGLWLGDGSTGEAVLTTMDPILRDIWCDWVIQNNDNIAVYDKDNNKAATYAATWNRENLDPVDRKSKINSNNLLKKLGLINNKHIPHKYLISSREQRLKLLAGIIDTDGYANIKDSDYQVITKLPSLAEDYAFLARSLGFKVTISPTIKQIKSINFTGTYYSVLIRGKLSEIPVQLNYKKMQDSDKDSSISGFRVEPLGDGDYYGFTLDGDHLYLLKDFTVTHNTSFFVSVIAANIIRQKKVLFMTHEDKYQNIRLKLLANMTKTPVFKLFNYLNDHELELKIKVATTLLDKYLKYIPYVRAGMTIEEVVPMIRHAQEERMLQDRLNNNARENEAGYDLFVCDYPAILSTDKARGGMSQRQIDKIVYSNYIQLAGEYNFHALLAIQTNREGSKINKQIGSERRLLEMEDVKESWDPMAEASNVITINRSPEAARLEYITFNMAKGRNNKKGVAVMARSNFACSITHSEELGGIMFEGSLTQEQNAEALLLNYNNQLVPQSALG